MSKHPHDPVGIVLCGGASSRMGRDKASMGDPPWSHRVARALTGAGCATVELQGGDVLLGTAEWLQLPDVEPGGGPVPAILQAAARHPDRTLVLAACDLPELTADAVVQLIEAVGSTDTGAAVHRVRDRANWSLVAVDSALASHLASKVPAEMVGASMHSLLADHVTMVEPTSESAVTDIDEPRELPEGRVPGGRGPSR